MVFWCFAGGSTGNFYWDPEGASSLAAACDWRSFRSSVPVPWWCFAGGSTPCFSGIEKGHQSTAGPTSSFSRIQKGSQASRQLVIDWRSFRPSVSLCFGVSVFRKRFNRQFFWDPEGRSSLAVAYCYWRSFRPSMPWCFSVSQAVQQAVFLGSRRGVKPRGS